MNTQNNSAIIAIVLLMVMFTNSGCKPEITGELGEPFDKREGMIGSWQLIGFTQQDINNPVKEIRDLSNFYIDGASTPLQLTFEEDGTYAVAIEIGKNYFGEGGTWAFDDPAYPSFLELHSSDTLVYNLGSMVQPFDNELNIEYRRACDGTTTVVYNFAFNRLN